jgi:formamidopyrimidine-DNA glycosylase
VRRLGTLAWMLPSQFLEYAGTLGPEPLDASFTPAALQATLGESSRVIKAALMDQTKLAGVGNIYATEALWDAGIDPSRETRSLHDSEWDVLHDALQRILEASIAARGTSFRDYRDASGGRGTYVQQLRAYGREGQPCVRCGRRLIGTHAIDGRNTVFCAECQH